MLSHRILRFGPLIFIRDSMYRPEMATWLEQHFGGSFMIEDHRSHRGRAVAFKTHDQLAAFTKEFS